MRTLSIAFLALACSLTSLLAQPAARTDYQQLHAESKEELRLLQERLDRVMLENKALKAELATLKKRPAKDLANGGGAPETPIAVPARPRASIPTSTEARLKLNEVINLQSIGGPDVRLEVKSFRYGSALVRIGSNQTDRKIEVRGDRTLIYQDADYEVYLVNRLVMAGEVTLQFVEKAQ